MKQLVESFLAKQINVKENEILANHTTMKIGGPAKVFVEPVSISELIEVVTLTKAAGLFFRVIGRGSNLLISDQGIDGVVIKLGKGLDHLKITEETVTVGAGYSLVTLATAVSKKGLTGLEFAAGIPGSVGGAVYMNAGAHGSDMSKILDRVHVLFHDGEVKWLSAAEMNYSYRTSILQKERLGIVLEATMNLKQGHIDEITKRMQENKNYRKKTQPYDKPCAGSIFRNPLPEYAGRLIEELGLKGYTIGGAKVSEMHGNFIINHHQATAKDVLDLIAYIKQVVRDQYQLEMETEVEIIN